MLSAKARTRDLKKRLWHRNLQDRTMLSGCFRIENGQHQLLRIVEPTREPYQNHHLQSHPQRDASILQVARKRCDGNGASHQGNANRDRYQTCEALRDSAYSPLAQAFLEASRRGETKLRYLEH